MAAALRPWAVLLAAGSGSRMAAATGNIPKQFFSCQGQPLYWRSACALAACPALAGLVCVFPQAFLAEERGRVSLLDRQHPLGVPWKVVAGGELRQHSVHCGLTAL